MAMSAAPMAGATAAIAVNSLRCANIAAAAWSAATSPPPPIAAGIVSPAAVPPAATSATATGDLIDDPGGSGDRPEPPFPQVPTLQYGKEQIVPQCVPLSGN